MSLTASVPPKVLSIRPVRSYRIWIARLPIYFLHLLGLFLDLKQLHLWDSDWLQEDHFTSLAHAWVGSVMQLVKLINVLDFWYVIDQFVLPVCHRFLGLLVGF